MSVGTSLRTVGKHALLARLLAREAEVIGRVSFIHPVYTMIDLTAGDGQPTGLSSESSPVILCRCRDRVRERGLASEVFLFEKDKATYGRLVQAGLGARCAFQDSRELQGLADIAPDSSAVFIHADPNHIDDWPISDGLLRDVNSWRADPQTGRWTQRWFVTLLVTIGCNVGGMKRLPTEPRRGWETKIEQMIKHLAKRQDCMLVTLRNDASQWAYLVVGPACWRADYEKDARDAFDYWDNGIDVFWYRLSPEKFWAEVKRLVYTKEELNAVAAT